MTRKGPLLGGRATFAVTLLVLLAYIGITGFVVWRGAEGDILAGILQNWHALAGLAAGFWLGSSVAGRSAADHFNGGEQK